MFVSGLTSSRKGAIAETAVSLDLLRAGHTVLRPIIEGSRYDLAVDTGATVLRVQCKWASRRGDVVRIHARTSYHGPGGYVLATYTRDEIDLIAAYCPEVDRCFYIPIAEVEGQKVIHLRLAPAKNNQRVGCKMASEYTLGAVAQLGERRAGSAKVRGSSPLSSTEPKAA